MSCACMQSDISFNITFATSQTIIEEIIVIKQIPIVPNCDEATYTVESSASASTVP